MSRPRWPPCRPPRPSQAPPGRGPVVWSRPDGRATRPSARPHTPSGRRDPQGSPKFAPRSPPWLASREPGWPTMAPTRVVRRVSAPGGPPQVRVGRMTTEWAPDRPFPGPCTSTSTGVATKRCEGLVCALPGAVVAAIWSVPFGCALALGTVIVALLGVPPRGAGRARVSVAGIVFAASYAVGTILIAWPPRRRDRAGRPQLCRRARGGAVPRRSVGRSLRPTRARARHEPPRTDGLLIAGTFAIGSAWATIVTLAWRSGQRLPPSKSRRRRGDRGYGCTPCRSPWPARSRWFSPCDWTSCTWDGPQEQRC